jgi:hypothetical protein
MLRAALVVAVVLRVGSAAAQVGTDVPLADILEILPLDRELLAVDARSGGQVSERLRIDEELLWTASRGGVGLALTDQRLLAVAVDSAAWQRLSRQLGEVFPERPLLGDRVGLLVTSRRAIGFDGGSGNLVEASLGLREKVLATRTGRNVAVVVTDRRALGLSPTAGGFFDTSMQLTERLEAVNAESNLATVRTNRRLLIFRSPTGSWEIRLRDLR